MGATEGALLAGILNALKELNRQQAEALRLLRVLAGEEQPNYRRK